MRFAFFLFSIWTLSAQGSAYDSLRSERRAEGLFVIHEVEEEETLYSIARRYSSSVKSIAKFNDVEDNRIEIGQILSVLVEVEIQPTNVEVPEEYIHIVAKGETLYTISRKYGLRVKQIKKLNSLEGNSLSLGQRLIVGETLPAEEKVQEKSEEPFEMEDPLITEEERRIADGFEAYLVQTGESLRSIARKLSVRVIDIKEWNALSSDYLRIGQKLWVKKPNEEDLADTDSASTNSRLDEDGFARVYEEGIAAAITDISTSRYLALHRSLPIGTELEVRNLMNNYVVHVKVVGKLPDTGINKNVMVRLSQPAYSQLGILDPKARVEVSYFKE